MQKWFVCGVLLFGAPSWEAHALEGADYEQACKALDEKATDVSSAENVPRIKQILKNPWITRDHPVVATLLDPSFKRMSSDIMLRRLAEATGETLPKTAPASPARGAAPVLLPVDQVPHINRENSEDNSPQQKAIRALLHEVQLTRPPQEIVSRAWDLADEASAFDRRPHHLQDQDTGDHLWLKCMGLQRDYDRWKRHASHPSSS